MSLLAHQLSITSSNTCSIIFVDQFIISTLLDNINMIINMDLIIPSHSMSSI